MTEEIDYQDYQKALQFDERISRMGAMQSLIDQIIARLNPLKEHVVLDAGTGTGRLGMTLHSRLSNGSVVGLDSGKGMLRVAREKIRNKQIDNFLLVSGRAESLPFYQQVFDSACLMLSFHHFTDPPRALREIRRVLKMRGYLVSLDPVLQEPSDEVDLRLNESIEEAFQEAHGPEFRFYTLSQLQDLYQDAGFAIGAVDRHDFSFAGQRMEVVPMGPHWLQARENIWFRKQRDLLQRFEENYFKFETTGNGLIVSGKMSWVLITAEKSRGGQR